MSVIVFSYEASNSFSSSTVSPAAAKQKPLAEEGLSAELLATGFGPEVHLG